MIWTDECIMASHTNPRSLRSTSNYIKKHSEAHGRPHPSYWNTLLRKHRPFLFALGSHGRTCAWVPPNKIASYDKPASHPPGSLPPAPSVHQLFGLLQRPMARDRKILASSHLPKNVIGAHQLLHEHPRDTDHLTRVARKRGENK